MGVCGKNEEVPQGTNSGILKVLFLAPCVCCKNEEVPQGTNSGILKVLFLDPQQKILEFDQSPPEALYQGLLNIFDV